MAKPRNTMPIVTEITSWKRHTHNFLDEALMTIAHDLGQTGMDGLDEQPIIKESSYPLLANYKLAVSVVLHKDAPVELPNEVEGY